MKKKAKKPMTVHELAQLVTLAPKATFEAAIEEAPLMIEVPAAEGKELIDIRVLKIVDEKAATLVQGPAVRKS